MSEHANDDPVSHPAQSSVPLRGRCDVCQLILLDGWMTCPRCGEKRGQRVAGASSVPGMRLLPLKPNQRYGVLEAIGCGGMAVVYLARDRLLNEVVALKVHQAAFDNEGYSLDLFKSELALARRISHPHIARLYDIFEWQGQLTISQAYIPGRDLAQVLRSRPLAPSTMLKYLRDLCSALNTAHKLGVTHRDIKPGNIRIDEDNRAHIIDFGLAAFTGGLGRPKGPAVILGSPLYMAPEQTGGPGAATPQTDIYSLGVVLFEMATGQLPFKGKDGHAIIDAHFKQAPPSPRSLNPAISPALEEVILHCLEKLPSRRIQTARELYEQAGSALLGESRAAPLREAPPPRRKVLVVDDDAATRALLAAIIAKHGLDVVEAADGREALALARSVRPAFLLLDIGMPNMDGREALRALRSDPLTRDLPVIMLTSADPSTEAEIARQAGANYFLSKPVQPDVINLIVARYA